MATTTLKVEGMTCQHCAQTVTRALESKDGVEGADVDLQSGRAQVRYDEGRVSPRELASAVAEEGYEAEEAT